MLEFLTTHFITILLMAGFSLKLAMRREAKGTEIRYLWLTVFCTAILVAEDGLEKWAALNPDWRTARLFLSVIGYSFRPIAALSVLMVVAFRYSHRRLLWIPAVINILIMSSAIFSSAAFSFDENYHFQRGPLGYSTHIVSFLYILLALFFTFRRFGHSYSWDSLALYLSAAGCVIAAVLETLYDGTSILNSAIMASAIFYYMFIESRDYNRDSLTGLKNRRSFMEDVRTREGRIRAVAVMNLNGLKRINDYRGPEAGDRLVIRFSKVLDEAATERIVPYRMSGNEFAVLFMQEDEENLSSFMELKKGIRESGCSVSAGFARREEGEDIQKLYRRAERLMRDDKNAYFASAEQ